MESLPGSARSKRHERLSRLREQSHISLGDDVSIGDEIVVLGRQNDERVKENEGESVTSGQTPKDESLNVEDNVTVDGDNGTEGGESEADMIQSSGIVPSVRRISGHRHDDRILT